MKNVEWNKKAIQKYINNNDYDYEKLNQKDKFGDTALMWACKFNPEIIPDLLKHPDIDVNIQNKLGKIALDVAKEENHESYNILKSHLEKDKIKNNINLNNKTQLKPKVL